MKKFLYFCLFGVYFLGIASVAAANPQSLVVGQWQTFDSHTKKPTSIMTIKREGQFYVARLTKSYATPANELGRCHLCKDKRHDQPMIGLVIIEGMTCDQTTCAGGTILDPRNGKVYQAKMRVIDHNQWLSIHGYIGLPILGRTVYWRRYE